MQVTPYLIFNGNCAEAFRAYEKALPGKIEFMTTHAEAPTDSGVPKELGDLILHATLRVGDQLIMASDSPPEYYEPMQGQYVTLTVDTPAEAVRLYAALSPDAKKIAMPLGETFWSPKFAMFVDRFGTPWMINTNQPPA
jgi:PhnB protein